MKNFLRNLHIGKGSREGGSTQEETVTRESSEAEERKREMDEEEEDELYEFQLRLAMEMNARDNPEAMEIQAANPISLGSCPPHSSPAEVQALRYLSLNALGYDDKILDGFYDIYSIGSASVTMPSLVELRAQAFSQKVNWESVLVDRREDPELLKLGEKALIISLEFRSRTSEFVGKALVQRLANLVACHMGGLIFDSESMSVKYQSMISSLRISIGSVVVPLGQLKIGLARHRALLFKVLADDVDVPCRLVKGRQYTGSDDGALNVVKFKDGREFIVDLASDPETLIPSDNSLFSTEFRENSISDNHYFNKDDTANLMGSSISGVSSSAHGSFEYVLPDRRSTSSNDGPSHTDGATTNSGDLNCQESQLVAEGKEWTKQFIITTKPEVLTYEFLTEITDNFSKDRELGGGAFGKVYKGVRKNGEEIAVKLLYDSMPGHDDEQFKNEFNNLMMLKHENTIRFVGYCYEKQQIPVEYNGKVVLAEKTHRALCFEYLQKGNLKRYLSDESFGLDWTTRYKIIKGTCEGLKYIHKGLGNIIYHLDLKPENILLDNNMVPKLADFGLSKIFGEDVTRTTANFYGTWGYIPPEYIDRNVISNKFDIFSLGVILIKIVTGPMGYSTSAEMPSQKFIDQAQGNWRNRLHAKLSGSLVDVYCQQVKACIEIALNCVEQDRHKRPTIVDIVNKLNEMEDSISKLNIAPQC